MTRKVVLLALLALLFIAPAVVAQTLPPGFTLTPVSSGTTATALVAATSIIASDVGTWNIPSQVCDSENPPVCATPTELLVISAAQNCVIVVSPATLPPGQVGQAGGYSQTLTATGTGCTYPLIFKVQGGATLTGVTTAVPATQ